MAAARSAASVSTTIRHSSLDFSSLELRTHGQYCLDQFGVSDMATELNKPDLTNPRHKHMADRILHTQQEVNKHHQLRDRLRAGDSDRQTIGFIVDRYGVFVLLRPPYKTSTLVLWIGPAVFLVAGAAGIVLWHRRRRSAGTAPAVPLSPTETARLDALLGRGDDRSC